MDKVFRVIDLKQKGTKSRSGENIQLKVAVGRVSIKARVGF